MLEILKFIFSDFWIFCGVVAILIIIDSWIVNAIKGLIILFRKDLK